jgi:hypothetical protein
MVQEHFVVETMGERVLLHENFPLKKQRAIYCFNE